MIDDVSLSIYKEYLKAEGLASEEELGYYKILDNGAEFRGFEFLPYEDRVTKLMECMDMGDLGLCGCYLPDDTREMLADVLATCDVPFNLESKEWGQARNKVKEWLKNPFAIFTFYVLNDKGYLEHGSSITHCWVTNKGLMYLNLVREYLSFGEDEVL